MKLSCSHVMSLFVVTTGFFGVFGLHLDSKLLLILVLLLVEPDSSPHIFVCFPGLLQLLMGAGFGNLGDGSYLLGFGGGSLISLASVRFLVL